MTVIWLRSIRKDKWLLHYGQIIMTEFQSVELNKSVKMRGRSPYRIISQWLDPMRNKVYVFKSKDIWFNPDEFMHSKEIQVWIDPNNPKKYLMDTSFLPDSVE